MNSNQTEHSSEIQRSERDRLAMVKVSWSNMGDAYQRGVKDARFGRAYSECPHQPNSFMGTAWRLGFQAWKESASA